MAPEKLASSFTPAQARAYNNVLANENDVVLEPMPRYSIIIPTYNSLPTLLPLLDALDAQTLEDAEVIVVDDASTDGTCAAVEERPVRLVRQEARRGPAAARNRGAALAQGEWFVFTDADTLFFPDTLAAIDAALSTCDADALVGTYAGEPANTGFMPRYKALWEQVIIDDMLLARGDALIPYNIWAPRPGVVRRSVFEALGGFNESFQGADLEDIDFGYRMVARGYRIYFAAEVKIRHHYPATFLQEMRPFARRCALWMRLRREKGGFDAAGEGSARQAFAHIVGFAAPWPWLCAPLDWRFAVLGLILPGAYAMLRRPFVQLAWREEGALFAARAFLVCWIHSLVLGVAAGYGLFRRMLSGCVQ